MTDFSSVLRAAENSLGLPHGTGPKLLSLLADLGYDVVKAREPDAWRRLQRCRDKGVKWVYTSGPLPPRSTDWEPLVKWEKAK